MGNINNFSLTLFDPNNLPSTIPDSEPPSLHYTYYATITAAKMVYHKA